MNCSYVYPVYVTIVHAPLSRTCSPTDASASAWKKGSPPENVTPSISLMARIRPMISSEETIVAGEMTRTRVETPFTVDWAPLHPDNGPDPGAVYG